MTHDRDQRSRPPELVARDKQAAMPNSLGSALTGPACPPLPGRGAAGGDELPTAPIKDNTDQCGGALSALLRKGKTVMWLRATSAAMTFASVKRPPAVVTVTGKRLIGLLQQMRDERRRRELHRRLGPDPTQAIDSPSTAIDVAEKLLACVRRHDVSEELWASRAVVPLSALLFAAAAQGGTGGIGWARHALINVDAEPDVPGWRQAADICRRSPGAAGRLGEDLLWVMTLAPRQRSSISVVMSDALTAWVGDAGARCNELWRRGR